MRLLKKHSRSMVDHLKWNPQYIWIVASCYFSVKNSGNEMWIKITFDYCFIIPKNSILYFTRIGNKIRWIKSMANSVHFWHIRFKFSLLLNIFYFNSIVFQIPNSVYIYKCRLSTIRELNKKSDCHQQKNRINNGE